MLNGWRAERAAATFGLVGVLSAALSGCWLAPIPLDGTDDGSVQSIEVGDVLQVRLEGNASTGHQWVRVKPKSFGQGPLKIIEEGGYDPIDADVCGGPGIFTYRYRAVASGTVSLTFVYRRPWEDEMVDEYSILVWVR